MTAGSARAPSLAGVLSLLEKHGTAVVLARDLETIASPDARAALHSAGVIAAAPSAASWPCAVRGCAREIRANYSGAGKPLVAVCFQVPAVCSPVELGFDQIAQHQVSSDALVAAVCGLLGAALDRAALAKVREVRPLGEVRPPVLVATLDGSARDVFWAGSPRDTDLAAWCARRARAGRGTLVLVPTTKDVPLEVAARFAPGDVVEVRAVGDLIAVRDGALALAHDDARAEAIPAARPMPAPSPASAPVPLPVAAGIAALLGVSRWEQIRFDVVDPHTVRIEANGKTLLRTFVELGFVDGRKRDIVTPTAAWPLFLLFYKRKRIKPSAYAEEGNKPFGVKKAIERIGAALRASFGLPEHPIHSYSKRSRLWEARFLVANGSDDSPPAAGLARTAARTNQAPTRRRTPGR